MSRITTVKDKIPKKASWPGFLASGKDTRIKVVLARKLEKQGLGSTPGLRLSLFDNMGAAPIGDLYLENILFSVFWRQQYY